MECFKTLATWKRCKSTVFCLFSRRSSALELGGKRSAAAWSVVTRAVGEVFASVHMFSLSRTAPMHFLILQEHLQSILNGISRLQIRVTVFRILTIY